MQFSVKGKLHILINICWCNYISTATNPTKCLLIPLRAKPDKVYCKKDNLP